MASWQCPKCNKVFGSSKKGIGIARSNHLKMHGINTANYGSRAEKDRLFGRIVN